MHLTLGQILIDKIRGKKTISKWSTDNLLLKICQMENLNNFCIDTDGEAYFLENLLSNLQDKENVVIFDVGANVGDYTKSISDYSIKYDIKTQIHSFEPLKECFAKLKQDFGLMSNIKLLNYAISENEGTSDIFFNDDNSTLASLWKRDLQEYDIKIDKSDVVSTIRLDNYIEKNNINHINLIKIDVEGNEFFVLKSLGKYLNPDFIENIQFEYGGTYIDSRTYLRDMYRLLENSGYQIGRLMPDYVKYQNYHAKMENFMLANYIATKKV